MQAVDMGWDTVLKRYPITPIPAPRMTQADRWKKRPCVMRYFAFRDEVKLRGITLPDCGAHVTFIMPMPDCWTAKKKAAMNQKPHQQTPDVDNLTKSLMDSIFGQDCAVWDIRATKVWGYEGAIEILET